MLDHWLKRAHVQTDVERSTQAIEAGLGQGDLLDVLKGLRSTGSVAWRKSVIII